MLVDVHFKSPRKRRVDAPYMSSLCPVNTESCPVNVGIWLNDAPFIGRSCQTDDRAYLISLIYLQKGSNLIVLRYSRAFETDWSL